MALRKGFPPGSKFNSFNNDYLTPRGADSDYAFDTPPTGENDIEFKTPKGFNRIWGKPLHSMFAHSKPRRAFLFDLWEKALDELGLLDEPIIEEVPPSTSSTALVVVHPLDFITELMFPLTPQQPPLFTHKKEGLEVSLRRPEGREAVYQSWKSMEYEPIKNAFLLLSNATQGYNLLLKKDMYDETLAARQVFILEMALAFLVLGSVLDYVWETRSPQEALLTLDDTVFHKFTIAIRFVPLLSEWLRGDIHEDVAFLRTEFGEDVMRQADDFERLEQSAKAVADWARTLNNMLGPQQMNRGF